MYRKYYTVYLKNLNLQPAIGNWLLVPGFSVATPSIRIAGSIKNSSLY